MAAYNSIVARILRLLFSIALICFWTAQAQTPPAAQKQAGQQQQGIPDETNPPEEDEAVAPKKYVLNPLESDRNIKVGNFYWNKKDYRGALDRYKDATRYNPRSPEAFLKVAETEEKLHNEESAKAAYQKVISLAPDSKFAAVARKKLPKS
jgi:tetratricopeptide (TPR) repeat protein